VALESILIVDLEVGFDDGVSGFRSEESHRKALGRNGTG